MTKVYKGCTCEVVYYDSRAADNELRDVRISEKEICVSFEGDQGWVNYKGKNNHNGHFHIKADDNSGSATLHLTPGELILEGSWKTTDDRGMLRIHMPDTDPWE